MLNDSFNATLRENTRDKSSAQSSHIKYFYIHISIGSNLQSHNNMLPVVKVLHETNQDIVINLKQSFAELQQ